MPRRCPPRSFCIENVTIGFIVLLLIIIGLFFYIRSIRNDIHNNNQTHTKKNNTILNYMFPSSGSNNHEKNDVFLDPYKAPLRDDRCVTNGGNDIRNMFSPSAMIPTASSSGFVPVNVSTQGCDDAKYRQVGILTRLNGKDETILPLMGRPLFTRRDKWNFYTLNDKNNMIKLPVTIKGRSGTDEYGCDNVYNGDTIFVEGYNDAFKVTAYDNQVMRYLPSSI
jgi:hypothetical protein